jgi:hypothetical protein
MDRKSSGRQFQGAMIRTKPGNEEIFRSLCLKRMELRKIIATIHEEGWTQNNGKQLTSGIRACGRLIRIGEVTDALGDRRGRLKAPMD